MKQVERVETTLHRVIRDGRSLAMRDAAGRLVHMSVLIRQPRGTGGGAS